MTETLRNRSWFTFKLWEDDRTLLQTLADRREATVDRYSALLALVPFAQALKLEDIRKRERKSLRVGIPMELHNELNRVKDETGQSLTTIILAAAREYAEQYPLPEPAEQEPEEE